MSLNSARVKITQSSGQHDKLQTAESPLKTGSVEKASFHWGKEMLFISVTGRKGTCGRYKNAGFSSRTGRTESSAHETP